MGTTAKSERLPAAGLVSDGFPARGGVEGSRETSFAEFRGMAVFLRNVRRSRWQWYSIVTIMLVLAFERKAPPALEVMVGLIFLIIAALPLHALLKEGR